MWPRHIIACILVFFILECVQLQQRQLLLLLCQWRLPLIRLQLVLEHHNRFVRRRRPRPHPYYWNLPRPCDSWFEIHFHRRNIPEEFFNRQMRMSAKFPPSPILHYACGSRYVVLCFATKKQQKQRIVP